MIRCIFENPHWVVKRVRLRDDDTLSGKFKEVGTYEVDSVCGKVLTNLGSDLDYNIKKLTMKCGDGSLLEYAVLPKTELLDESKIEDAWESLKSELEHELELEPQHEPEPEPQLEPEPEPQLEPEPEHEPEHESELEIEAEPESQHEHQYEHEPEIGPQPEPEPEIGPEPEQREFAGAVVPVEKACETPCPSKKRPFEVIPDSRDDDPITPGQNGNKKPRISNSMSTGGDYYQFAAPTPLTTAPTPSTTTVPADSNTSGFVDGGKTAIEQAMEIARKAALGLKTNDGDAQQARRWNPLDASMVAQVKSALHPSTAPGGEVLCREAERKQIVGIFQTALESKRGASMYVCGLPGTGKSLTVSEAEKVAQDEGARVVAVNCMTLGNPQQVFARIIEELGVTPKSDSEAADASPSPEVTADASQSPEVRALREFVKGGDVTVILLDEMDQLVSKAQGILYELFGLQTLPGSRCVVVGVANCINLVESTLPNLAGRGCKPVVVRFNAYKIDQLERLLRQRLTSLPWTVFEDAGLKLCARKVAAATGDMRRALNICAAAVDLCAREANEAPAEAEERDAASAENASLVKISHMARAISASFSSPVVDTMRDLSLPQQMVLCAAVRLFRDAPRKEATLGELNETYKALCKEAEIRRGLKSGELRLTLSLGEFSDVCTVLADQTLLRVGPGREDRQRKTSLAVHENDVVFALQEANLLFRNLIGEKGSTSASGGN